MPQNFLINGHIKDQTKRTITMRKVEFIMVEDVTKQASKRR